MIGSAVNADRLDIYAPKYPNTRDDSGATTPINFLYTDASGNFLSAPTSALGGGAGWSLTGNAGTTVGTNFIGTTDAQDLMFKVDNTPSGRINIDKENTSLGYGSNNSGFGNTAVGFNALSINTNGSNVAVGSRVLEASTNAKFNVGLGYNALKLSTGGSGNIAVGAYAGDAITTGSENIIIGGSQDTPTATTDQFLNIGGAIFGTGLTGNQLAPAGNIGIGKVAPAEKLDVAGSFHNQTQLTTSGRYTGFYSGLNTIGGGYQSSSIYNMPNPTIGAGELLNYVSVQDGASIIGSTQDVTSATGESATGTFLAGDIYLETKDNNSNSFAVLRVQTPNQGKNLWNSVQDPSGINNSTTIDFDAASPIAFKFSTLGVYSEYRFPRTDGTANQVLTTDGSGNLSWSGGNSLKLYHENPITGYISPVASGDNSVAIGHNATTAAGTNRTTAVGFGATASGNNSQAFGESTNASGDQAIAIGGHVSTTGTDAIGLGLAVGANGRESIVIGIDANANSDSSLTVGHHTTNDGESTIAIGHSNNVSAGAVGGATLGSSNNITATSSGSFAFGESTTADGSRSIIFSSGGNVTGDGSVILGSGSPSITGDSSVVVGSGVINGTTSSSVGNGNTITGDGSVTMGNSNNISVANAYAFGEANTISSIKGSIALGASNTIAGGQRGIALGQGNTVTGNQAIAIGDSNDVTTGAGSHPFTAAFGHDNTVNGQVITAIGNGINASQNNTIILGPDSGTWVSNVGIGTSTPTAKLDVNGNARIQTIPTGTGTDEVVTVDASGNVRKVSMGTVASGGLLTYVEESLTTGAVDFTTWTNGNLIPFAVENLDDHSDFDTSTYTFTAPANGTYKISGTLGFENIILSGGNQVNISSYMIFTGAAAGITGRYTETFVNDPTFSDNFHLPFSRLVQMNAGDTMTMDLHITAGGGTSFTSGTLQGSSTFLTIQQVK